MTSSALRDAAQPDSSTEAPIRAIGPGDVGLLAGLSLAEAAALAMRIAAGGHPVLDLAGIHLLTIIVLAGLVLLARRQRRDVTYPLIALIGGAAMGPLGVLGAAFLSLFDRRSPSPNPLIAQWYDRIAMSTTVAPEERLCEDVSVGRTLDLDARPPISYPDAMTSGSIAERQAILGHIARHFHPAYLPTLKIALASEEPLIRVQAAAVAAHVAPKVRDQLRRCTAEAEPLPADQHRALALLGDIEALMESGLLDETDRLNAQGLARRLGDTVLASLGRGPLALPYATDIALAAEIDARLERLLLARRRFADLRAHRTAQRISRHHPRSRLRRLAIHNRIPEAAE